MTKTELRNIMTYNFPPIDEDDREEIDTTKNKIRSEGGRDRVSEEILDITSRHVDKTISSANQHFYGQYCEIAIRLHLSYNI